MEHFPSIAQLTTLGETLISRPPRRRLEVVPEVGPWHPRIEGLMLLWRRCLRTGEDKTGFALRHLGLTHDEAGRLYDAWSEGRYDDPEARALIAKTRDGSIVKTLMKSRRA